MATNASKHRLHSEEDQDHDFVDSVSTRKIMDSFRTSAPISTRLNILAPGAFLDHEWTDIPELRDFFWGAAIPKISTTLFAGAGPSKHQAFNLRSISASLLLSPLNPPVRSAYCQMILVVSFLPSSCVPYCYIYSGPHIDDSDGGDDNTLVESDTNWEDDFRSHAWVVFWLTQKVWVDLANQYLPDVASVNVYLAFIPSSTNPRLL
ncbi:hypothetical protein GGX14DRAFT_652472 [Mycena pura]|uniref:Uncharacterized protein n=1 Tax=Mycena pura TaxID=153505 RepID=A0AAD6V5G9_9AGAR|nr:hypothetical protein GGX14DRAFT_652472 [Mycena pura]